MAKIPKNLSDKDMFANYQEEKSLEDLFLEDESRNKKKKIHDTSLMKNLNIAYITPDIVERLDKLLLELKLALYQDGILDYEIKVERVGEKIILSPVKMQNK